MKFEKAQFELDDEYANLFFDVTEIDDSLNTYLKIDKNEYYEKYDALLEKIKNKYDLIENLRPRCFQEIKTKQEIQVEQNKKISSIHLEMEKLKQKIEKAEHNIQKDKQKLEKLKSSMVRTIYTN
jgi:predicted RNase H-like nuclease (RuvC/YqgF family)